MTERIAVRRHTVAGGHRPQRADIFIGPRITHHTNGAHRQQHGKGLPDLVIQTRLANGIQIHCIRSPQDIQLFRGDFARHTDGKAGARERVPSDQAFGKTQLAPKFAHFILEQLTQRLWSSSLLHEQAEVLELLQRRLGSQKVQLSRGKRPIELRQLLAEVYQHGLRCQDWNVVRRCAGAMGMVHPQLEDALTDLLVRQKQVVVGRNYTGESRLNQPQDSTAIAERIERTSGIDARERMLEQELLLALDSMVRREPSLLDGSLTLQLGQLLLLLTSELSGEQGLSQDEAFEVLCCEPPHRIRSRLRTVLTDVDHAKAALKRSEQLHVSGRVQWTVPDPLERRPGNGDWLQHRIRLGSLQQVPRDFYAGIWSLLQHCRGLVIGDKLERRNRLNSRLVLEKTAGERNFATLVDHLLSRIEAPEYRQLCCECLLSLMAFVETNADVHFDDDLALDVVIGHAVRVGWQHTHPSMHVDDYARHKAQAWGQFYLASPGDCRRWQVIALKELAEQNGLV